MSTPTTENVSPRATTTGVHPSAVGTANRPDVTNTNPSAPSDADPPRALVDDSHSEYPEQRHAGAIGYGPNFHQGPTMGEKISGVKEIVKGKVTRKPELVEHGREKKTGILREKERDADLNENPFEDPGAKQASTVAPEGAGHSHH